MLDLKRRARASARLATRHKARRPVGLASLRSDDGLKGVLIGHALEVAPIRREAEASATARPSLCEESQAGGCPRPATEVI
ncbi:hypothetical protein [Sphingorhabdus sp. Alg231-15]|uniref:hypothetical protein n=1 Tax=Sphingorhabdus sp. Alg231-15 TaxID=1922222 RepID=UPI000D557D5B